MDWLLGAVVIGLMWVLGIVAIAFSIACAWGFIWLVGACWRALNGYYPHRVYGKRGRRDARRH